MARDAETGAELWRFETAGAIVAAPVAYEIGGRQYIAIAAGHSLVALALPESAGEAKAGLRFSHSVNA